MASRCVSAISALHPSIAALGLLSRGSGLILLIHTSKPCYIYYIQETYIVNFIILIERDYKQCQRRVIEDTCQRIAATIHDTDHHFGVNRSLDVITAKYY